MTMLANIAKRMSTAQPGAVPRAARTVRDERGESLTEVLAAIVVGGLAILMLAVVISAALNMVQGSRDTMSEYYAVNNASVENATGNATGTVTLTDSSGATVRLGANAATNVTYSINEQVDGTPVASYEQSS